MSRDVNAQSRLGKVVRYAPVFVDASWAADHASRRNSSTPTVVAASNLSFGPGASVIVLSPGAPDRDRAPFRAGHEAGIRPVIRDGRLGGEPAVHVSVSRLSAAGVRFSAILFPPMG
jgi:hypothetical protein